MKKLDHTLTLAASLRDAAMSFAGPTSGAVPST